MVFFLSFFLFFLENAPKINIKLEIQFQLKHVILFRTKERQPSRLL